MTKRDNLSFKKIRKKRPNDVINVTSTIPVYLLPSVRKFGDVTKLIRAALELYNNTQYREALSEIIGLLKKEIEKLEILKETEPEKMKEPQLQLLEIYKDVYFRLRKAKILRKQRNK